MINFIYRIRRPLREKLIGWNKNGSNSRNILHVLSALRLNFLNRE
jgi:hypothetical protein